MSNLDRMKDFGCAELVKGSGAFALVSIPGRCEYYFVLTVEERSIPKYVHKLADNILLLPGSPQVEWVRPLTRRLQRLFGWGDVASTREDVVRAAKADDQVELRVLMPQAARLLESIEVAQLPGLHDALRIPPAALEDCKHQFFQENGYERVPGPCKHGAAVVTEGKEKHMKPFTRCVQCKMTCCVKCAREAGQKQEEREDLKDVLDKCVQSPSDAPPAWLQHPTRPMPFYVIDQQKVPEAEKLAWIKQEVGHDAGLYTFAVKFLDIFGEKVHGTVPQKNACLHLYGSYVPKGSEECTWKKESDMPPASREEFCSAWGRLDKLCRECARPRPAARRDFYCSNACAVAGFCYSCPKCHKKLQGLHPYCWDCKAGTAPPKRALSSTAASTSLVETLKRGLESMAMIQRTLFTSVDKDPDHVPEWKKRRRC